MAADMPPDLKDRLSHWRDIVAQARQAEQTPLPPAATQEEEEYLLRILKILLWCAGLLACVSLAWQATGGSLIGTLSILAIPLTAWRLFGLGRWGLLLPMSLIAALALLGTLRLG